MNELGLAKCLINKIQTTLDGGARITLDLGAQDKEIISKLLSLKLSSEEQVICVFIKPDDSEI